jgi:hypothetical protein
MTTVTNINVQITEENYPDEEHDLLVELCTTEEATRSLLAVIAHKGEAWQARLVSNIWSQLADLRASITRNHECCSKPPML